MTIPKRGFTASIMTTMTNLKETTFPNFNANEMFHVLLTAILGVLNVSWRDYFPVKTVFHMARE